MPKKTTKSPSPSPKKTPSRRSSGGTLIGMFIGLVMGILLAAGVVLYMNKAALPFNKDIARAAPEKARSAETGEPPKPLALPGKPGDPLPEKRFQFYDILSGKAEPVPATEKPEHSAPPTLAKGKDKAENGKSAKAETPKADIPPEKPATGIFLQAGSFASASEADNQKAKLAFMGMEAAVQQIMVQDKTFYRVRLGPFKNDEARSIKKELSSAGVDAQVVN